MFVEELWGEMTGYRRTTRQRLVGWWRLGQLQKLVLTEE